MRSAARSDTRPRNVNSTLETIHAAATAIAAVEDRDHPATPVQKRRWSGWLSLYWCFGSCKHQTRIGHAIFVPETTNLQSNHVQNHTQTTTILLPFIAPPSSPASFFQSEPPSVTQSPSGLLSTSLSASMFSPNGPHSIFAIGPYANETQLVSPPIFSPFPTEPSTAPFTPPPESVHLNTTPSSPEVPFATTNGGFPFSHYEFPSYQLSPGSPISHLISPGSVISNSGTSSPFPGPIDPNFLDFLANGTPKLLELEKQSAQWSSRPESGSITPDPAKVHPQDEVRKQNDDAEKVSGGSSNNNSEKKRYHLRRRSITLGSSREFDFENVEGDESNKARIGSAWCVNEKVGDDNGNGKNWSFPVIQSSVS